MIRKVCGYCVLGTIHVPTCMGNRLAPCPKCGGNGYRWTPRDVTVSDYDDAALEGNRDDFESIIDGLCVS